MIVCASRLFHISLVVSKTTGWLVPRHPNNSIIRETGHDGSRRTTVLASVSPSSSDFSIFDGQDEKQASDNVAERLREDARKLRAEIEEYEKRKQDIAMIERENIEAELKARQKIIDRYSVVVPVLKADGTTVNETIQFPPMLEESSGRTGSSKILLCEAAFPLGILLGEHQQLEGMTTVDEVVAGSNGELAGIKEGDLLRACTACKVELVSIFPRI